MPILNFNLMLYQISTLIFLRLFPYHLQANSKSPRKNVFLNFLFLFTVEKTVLRYMAPPSNHLQEAINLQRFLKEPLCKFFCCVHLFQQTLLMDHFPCIMWGKFKTLFYAVCPETTPKSPDAELKLILTVIFDP